MKKILVTGGCGFIGHHFVEHFIKETDWEVIVLDKLSEASHGFNRLRDIDCFNEKRVKIFATDLNVPINDGIKKEIGEVDYIINMASESHVDNSIVNPVPFIKNNINLVLNMLEWLREMKNVSKFVQFSSDETMGVAPLGVNYKEGDRINPGNPYSASKAAQEAIVMAYANTYQLPIIITNTMNVIGERQDVEKFVPMVIKKVLDNETVTIHADKTKTIAGSRFYIHARNVAKAIHFILDNVNEKMDKIDASKGKFHIVGEKEIDNLSLAQMIAKSLRKELKYEMVDFHSSRPGHDLRYAMDGTKMKNLGWEPPMTIEDSLHKVVQWTIKHSQWLLK